MRENFMALKWGCGSLMEQRCRAGKTICKAMEGAIPAEAAVRQTEDNRIG
jgi:hypothetical protein